MNTKSRIKSILNTNSLDSSITGIKTFNLSTLDIDHDLTFNLPTNLRLGHLAEKIIAELLKASSNFNVIYENIQVVEEKMTIGEIDFIIQNNKTNQITHMELAYKFYLYDPNISSLSINNWIGPNRNDSLKKKLDKLKNRQFPLIHHEHAKSKLKKINVEGVVKALCFLVSLYIPYKQKITLDPIYKKAIKGYYLNFDTFTSLNNAAKTYYIPHKSEWGIDPQENDNWMNYNGVEIIIREAINNKKAPLCWQKEDDLYISFFITWW